MEPIQRRCRVLQQLLNDAIEKAWLAWGRKGRTDAEARIRDAWRLLTRATMLVAELQSFVAHENVEGLIAWSRSQGAPVRLRGGFDAYGRLVLGEGARTTTMPIPREVIDPVPTIEALE